MSMVVEILENFLGRNRGHNHTSGQMQFDCPACSDDEGRPEGNGKGHLEVNYNKGWFHCWSCGETNRMKGYLPYLFNRYGTPKLLKDFYLVKPEFKEVGTLGQTAEMKLPKGFKLLSKCNPSHYKCDQALHYLHNRGITDDLIEQYKIGYTVEDKYKNRIIVPSYDVNNELSFFIGRAFEKRMRPKILNEDAEKSIIIFNEFHINWDATVYLVEGPFDHLVTPNSIPMLGKTLHNYLNYMLQTKAMGDVVIVVDGDAWETAKDIYRQLNIGNLRGRVKVVQLSYKYDPAAIVEKFGRKRYMKVLSNSKTIPEARL